MNEGSEKINPRSTRHEVLEGHCLSTRFLGRLDVLTEQCEPDGDSLPQGAAGGATKKKTTRRRNDPGLIVAAAVSSVATLVLAGLVAFYACRRPAGRDLEGPVEIKTPPHEETKHSA